MKKLSKREKLLYTTLILVVIAILLLSIVTDIYARYSSTLIGEGSIELARWEFKVNDKKEGEAFNINIKTTEENETKISPNSTGTFQLVLENLSNVPAEYTISLAETFLNTNTETDTLKIYTDASYSDDTIIDINNKNIVGKLKSNTSKTIVLHWKWVENAEQDQLIAENYDGFTISATVVGEQTTLVSNESTDYSIENK